MACVLSMALGFLFYFYVSLLQNSHIQVQIRQMPRGYKDYCIFGQRESIFNVKSAYQKLKLTTSTGRAFSRGQIQLYRNGTATSQLERIKLLGIIHPNPGPNRKGSGQLGPLTNSAHTNSSHYETNSAHFCNQLGPPRKTIRPNDRITKISKYIDRKYVHICSQYFIPWLIKNT